MAGSATTLQPSSCSCSGATTGVVASGWATAALMVSGLTGGIATDAVAGFAASGLAGATVTGAATGLAVALGAAGNVSGLWAAGRSPARVRVVCFHWIRRAVRARRLRQCAADAERQRHDRQDGDQTHCH